MSEKIGWYILYATNFIKINFLFMKNGRVLRNVFNSSFIKWLIIKLSMISQFTLAKMLISYNKHGHFLSYERPNDYSWQINLQSHFSRFPILCAFSWKALAMEMKISVKLSIYTVVLLSNFNFFTIQYEQKEPAKLFL